MLTIKYKAMKTLSIITAIVLGVFATNGALAEKPESTYFHLASNAKYYKTSFTMASHLVVLPFSINGSDSLNLIFDTGVGRTLITDLPNPNAVSFSNVRRVRIKGLGNNEGVEGYLSDGNDLSLGKLNGQQQQVLVVPNNVIDLSAKVGYRVNGAIGQSIFEKFIVEINYATHTAQFHKPKEFRKKLKRNEEVIPLELINGKPYVTAIVTVNGKQIPVKLLFDTGMSFALWLDPNSNEAITPGALRQKDVLGHGLSGEVTGTVSRIEKFQLGSFEFNNVVTAFPDSSSIGEATRYNNRNGSIGAELFRRFNVIIDYNNQRLILRKNGHYKEPFRYDMSGMDVSPILPGLPLYRIAVVKDNSPAQQAGLRVNDELYSINGVLTQKMTLHEITTMLKKKSGKTIRIQVYRNGELVKAKFKLREMV